MPQLQMGIVHFLVASLVAKYMDFITTSLRGNESLFLAYFKVFSYFFEI